MQNSAPESTAPPATRLRVLLAEHSPQLRHTLREHLGRLPSVELVGEAQNSQDALNLLLWTRPDVIVVSISIPDQGGFEVLRTIKQVAADRAVVLTYPLQDPFVREAATLLGAVGVCPTTDGFAELSAILQRLSQTGLVPA